MRNQTTVAAYRASVGTASSLAVRRNLVPTWGLRLLVFAAGWTVFLSSVSGIVAPGFAAQLSSHQHETLNDTVPVHTHASFGAPGPACMTDDHAAALGGSSERVVCAPGNDGATGSSQLLAASGPVRHFTEAMRVLPALPVVVCVYVDAAIRLLTPPPRG
jgi:hypothetical protein